MKMKISMNIDWFICDKITQRARELGLTRSELIEQILVNYLIDKGIISEEGGYKKEDV